MPRNLSGPCVHYHMIDGQQFPFKYPCSMMSSIWRHDSKSRRLTKGGKDTSQHRSPTKPSSQCARASLSCLIGCYLHLDVSEAPRRLLPSVWAAGIRSSFGSYSSMSSSHFRAHLKSASFLTQHRRKVSCVVSWEPDTCFSGCPSALRPEKMTPKQGSVCAGYQLQTPDYNDAQQVPDFYSPFPPLRKTQKMASAKAKMTCCRCF